MRILLIGDYGGLHSTLASGLRVLGHEVCVVSDGNGWKNYPRDISFTREKNDLPHGLLCMGRIVGNLPKLRGYDIVQTTHCPFIPLRSERNIPLYRYLRRNNGKIFMGAFGTDHYYVKACLQSDTYRYSDFKVGNRKLDIKANEADIKECLEGKTVEANKEIASTCNGIIACLWEYYAAYKPYFPEKTGFIPLPFNTGSVESRIRQVPDTVNFFVGIQRARHEIKGTDVMLRILKDLSVRYPDICRITTVCDVPYQQYIHTMDNADVMLDQLYSYTPAMNALLAMAKGIVVCGGGEQENYDIIAEQELRPIINLYPSEDDIRNKLEELILHKERIPELSAQSIEYVHRHHDHIKVAQQYLDFWASH